ncbi:MAG: acyl-CoA dehydrogenase family protein [Hyphomonadaceae bacterium]|nr:acyl-CoA dehydrogenase family protein [Hyphomonadaceae bacterium]
MDADQRALTATIEKFAHDTYGARSSRTPEDAPADYSVSVWRRMSELGLTGLCVPEECGGLGFSVVEILLVSEILGRALSPEPFATAAIVAAKLLEASAAGPTRDSMLLAISNGEVRLAPAFYESVADYDLQSVDARISDEGGRLYIHGVKELVVDGAGATHFIVTARSEAGEINAYVVPVDVEGVKVSPRLGLDGRWLASAEFNGAAVEGDAPLFESGEALANVEHALDFGNLSLCAEALGLMDRMLHLTAMHLAVREQFGKPIGTFQALQHRFADMVVAMEQSRSVTWMAAAALESGELGAGASDLSAAKSAVCRYGRTVLEGAIQLHGGMGMTADFELAGYVRRLLAIEKTWGDRVYHELRFLEAS